MITHELQRLEKLATLLDSHFRIPGTKIRFGLDSVVGLVPVIGDAVALVPSVYLIARAHMLGARKRTVARMAANAGVDWIAGSVPIVGDLLDVGFKANLRNVRLLQADLLNSGRQSAGPDQASVRASRVA